MHLSKHGPFILLSFHPRSLEVAAEHTLGNKRRVAYVLIILQSKSLKPLLATRYVGTVDTCRL